MATLDFLKSFPCPEAVRNSNMSQGLNKKFAFAFL